MALLNGVNSHKYRLNMSHNTSWAFFASLSSGLNQVSRYQHHPPGLCDANMGDGRAEFPSASAAVHGGMCGSHYRRAEASQPCLPHHWQQRVWLDSLQLCSMRSPILANLRLPMSSDASWRAGRKKPCSSLATIHQLSPFTCNLSSLVLDRRWETKSFTYTRNIHFKMILLTQCVFLRCTSTVNSLRGILKVLMKARKLVIM